MCNWLACGSTTDLLTVAGAVLAAVAVFAALSWIMWTGERRPGDD